MPAESKPLVIHYSSPSSSRLVPSTSRLLSALRCRRFVPARARHSDSHFFLHGRGLLNPGSALSFFSVPLWVPGCFLSSFLNQLVPHLLMHESAATQLMAWSSANSASRGQDTGPDQ